MGKISEGLNMELPGTLLADSDTLNEIEKALGPTPKGRSGNKIPFDAASPVDEAGHDSPPACYFHLASKGILKLQKRRCPCSRMALDLRHLTHRFLRCHQISLCTA